MSSTSTNDIEEVAAVEIVPVADINGSTSEANGNPTGSEQLPVAQILPRQTEIKEEVQHPVASAPTQNGHGDTAAPPPTEHLSRPAESMATVNQNGHTNGHTNGGHTNGHGTNGTALPQNGTTATPADPSKPVLLVLCTSSTAPGHVLPLCELTRHLVSKCGYEATFVGGNQHRHLIAASGATFFPVHESLTLEKGPFRKWGMERARYEEGLPRMRQDFKTFFIGQIPGQFESTKSALLDIRRRYGCDREVLVINETMWFGYLPFKFGAPAPEGFFVEGNERKMPKSIGVNVTPLMLDSVDLPAMPLGLLPVEGQGGDRGAVRERDALIRDLLYKYVVKEAYDGFREHMKACGGTQVPDEWMINLSVTAHDATLQMCDEALEYPRSDLPPHVHFAGSLARRPVPQGYVFPEWWQRDVVAPAQEKRRHVVVVSQGTLARDYSMLVAPTVAALAGREDVLVIALLGKPGAELMPGILPPTEGGRDNIRVADFIPYDAVLAYADVMVFNAGYGGFVHCVVNGVPMVAAGLTEDKCEVAARAEWAGVGINLRTGRPSAFAIAAAVDTILASPDTYRARAKELALQVGKGDPLAVIEREVLALTGAN
ncbi:glycosyltransferase family 1 protein [Podospora didyma]|uniref:Glycosyltransferase family 1 protein n=1 Tax=Podospora didyma TaxID=330526 RepID=A0AAE0NQZ9_9PEZI|nr:glycosyltransferase family 1 protein [Podospora didyma]